MRFCLSSVSTMANSRGAPDCFARWALEPTRRWQSSPLKLDLGVSYSVAPYSSHSQYIYIYSAYIHCVIIHCNTYTKYMAYTCIHCDNDILYIYISSHHPWHSLHLAALQTAQLSYGSLQGSLRQHTDQGSLGWSRIFKVP